MGSIEARTYVGNEYKLPRGGQESIRLTAQHHTMTARQGWLLHPEVATAIKEISNPRIADVATGNGIWALDMAQQMPHAEVIGLDISDEQFPASWTWPSNVSLGLYDLLEEVPAQFQGVFDVVHVRLLLTAGPAVDKAVFIDRFRTLLRPGGWLQWDELAYPNLVACRPTPKEGIVCVKLLQHPMVQVSAKYIKLDERIGWIAQFEENLSRAGGFDRAARVEVPVRPHLLQTESDLGTAVMTAFIQMLIKNQDIAEVEVLNELQGALDAFYADVNNGTLFSYNWSVCIAQKSSSRRS